MAKPKKRQKTGKASHKAGKVQRRVPQGSTGHETRPVPKLNLKASWMPNWDDWPGEWAVTLEEAVTLSCNLDPLQFLDQGSADYHSFDTELFEKRIEIAKRVPREVFCLKTPVPPYEVSLVKFAKWAVKMGRSYPLGEKLPDRFCELASPTAKDELHTKIRKTLLKIIAALAKGHVDLSEPYKAGDVIELLTVEVGLRVASRTIGGYLTEAEELIKNRPPKPPVQVTHVTGTRSPEPPAQATPPTGTHPPESHK